MMVLVIDFMRSTPFLIDQRKLMVSLAVNVFRIPPKRNHAAAHSYCRFEPSWLFFLKEGDLINFGEKKEKPPEGGYYFWWSLRGSNP